MLFIGLAVLIGLLVFTSGFVLGLKYSNQEIEKLKNLSTKHLELFKIAVRWIKDSQKIEKYIRDNGYKKIAIYGMSYLGDCLEEILFKSGIGALYGIDKNADKLYNSHIAIYSMESDLTGVDVVVVTTAMYYEQIRSELEMKMGNETTIISLEEILYM